MTSRHCLDLSVELGNGEAHRLGDERDLAGAGPLAIVLDPPDRNPGQAHHVRQLFTRPASGAAPGGDSLSDSHSDQCYALGNNQSSEISRLETTGVTPSEAEMPRTPELEFPLSDEWRDQALAALESRGRGARTRLAKKCGTSKATITRTLDKRRPQATSTIVDCVSRDLEIPLPDEVDWHRLGDSLRQTDRRLYENMKEFIRTSLEGSGSLDRIGGPPDGQPPAGGSPLGDGRSEGSKEVGRTGRPPLPSKPRKARSRS